MTRNFQLSQSSSRKPFERKKRKNKKKNDEKFSAVSVQFAKITRKKKKKKKDSDEKVWQLFNLRNQTEFVNNFLSLFTTIPREIVGK